MSARRKTALLTAGLLASAGAFAARAQDAGPAYDPSQMPALHGKVAQYDLTPRGDVDGLILDDGTEVHFPPRLGTEIVAIVRPGQEVTIHGLRARALPLMQAMSVTDESSGRTVVDNAPPAASGPPPAPPPGQDLQAEGRIRMQLHGPRGELNGVLLADGTMIHFPPVEASLLEGQLQPGMTIAVRGDGVSNPLGRSIDARAVGPSMDRLASIDVPPRPGHGGRPGAPPPPDPTTGPGAPPPAPPPS